MSDKKLSVIIVTYNSADVIGNCLRSIEDFCKSISHEVIVVDNRSRDGGARYIKDNFPSVTVVENTENAGYAAANNIGIERSRGEYIVIMNSDVRLLDDIGPFLEFMDKNRQVGLSGAAIYDTNMKAQRPDYRFPGFFSELYKLTVMSVKDFGRFFPSRSLRPAGGNVTDVDWVVGCFMLTRRESLERAGCMDERYFLYYEDTDLCYTISKYLGMRVIVYPSFRIMHLGGSSTKFSDGPYLDRYFKSAVAYFRKHKGPVFAGSFMIACALSWTAMLIFLWALFLIKRDERIVRKINMFKHVLGRPI